MRPAHVLWAMVLLGGGAGCRRAPSQADASRRDRPPPADAALRPVTVTASDVASATDVDDAVPPPGARQIAAGDDHTCAVMHDHTVRCWGYNHEGQLGDGTSHTRAAPVVVRGITDAAQVAVGGPFSCVVRDSGAVSCWGRNGEGHLGDGTLDARRAPATARHLGAVAEVALGANHSCARLGDGTVWCWGDDEGGAVGDGVVPGAPVSVRW